MEFVIPIKIDGKNRDLRMSFEQARGLYGELHKIFGNRVPIIQPIIIKENPQSYPIFGTEIICSGNMLN